jgi:hypothetical protein
MLKGDAPQLAHGSPEWNGCAITPHTWQTRTGGNVRSMD